MAYTKSKYTKQQNQNWTVAAMIVLSDAQEAMTCDQIRQSDLELVGVTPQKMARILSGLVERGLVVKTKGKDGRMRYKSVGVIIEQGYNLNEIVY